MFLQAGREFEVPAQNSLGEETLATPAIVDGVLYFPHSPPPGRYRKLIPSLAPAWLTPVRSASTLRVDSIVLGRFPSFGSGG